MAHRILSPELAVVSNGPQECGVGSKIAAALMRASVEVHGGVSGKGAVDSVQNWHESVYSFDTGIKLKALCLSLDVPSLPPWLADSLTITSFLGQYVESQREHRLLLMTQVTFGSYFGRRVDVAKITLSAIGRWV